MISRNSVIFAISLFFLGGAFLVWHSRVQLQGKFTFDSEIVSDRLTSPPLVIPAALRSAGLVPLTARGEGVVTKITVRPGDFVRTGQVLTVLDVSDDQVKTYERFQRIANKFKHYDPNKALHSIENLEKDGFYNPTEGDDERMQIMKSARDYIAFQTTLEDYWKRTQGKIIVAPFDGFVSEINWRVGDYIQPGRALVPGISLYRPGEKFEARLEVPDEVIGKLQVGQKVELWSPAGASERLFGKIDNVSTTAFQTDRGRYFVVNVLTDYAPAITGTGKEQRLLPSEYQIGMRLMASVEVNPPNNGVWIPRAAIDILIPDGAVDATVSYLDEGKSEALASRVRSEGEKTGKSSLRDVNSKTKSSPMGRAIASATTTSPTETKTTTVFLLSSDGKVVKATVRSAGESENYVFVPHHELNGARVITHYRQRSGLGSLLSKSAD